MKKNYFYKFISFFLIIVLSVSIFPEKLASSAERIRPLAKDLPDGTIIIGSFLIDLKALTVEVQTMAEESASPNEKIEKPAQPRIYYKSDLNSGIWYDITEAKGISDISSTTNNVISNEEIDQLFLEYYVKEDGSILSLLSGEMTKGSQIFSKIDPKNMPELEPILSKQAMLDGLVKTYEEMDIDEDEEDDKENLSLLAVYRMEQQSNEAILALIEDEEAKTILSELEKMESSMGQLTDLESIDKASAIKQKKKYKLERLCYEQVKNRLEIVMKDLAESDATKHSEMIGIDGDVYTAIVGKIDELTVLLGTDANSTMAAAMEKADNALENALIQGQMDGISKALNDAKAIESLLDGTANEIPDNSELQKVMEQLQEELFQKLLQKLSSLLDEIINGTTKSKESLLSELDSLAKDVVSKIDEIFSLNQNANDKKNRNEKYQSILNKAISSLKEKISSSSKTPKETLQAILDYLQSLVADSQKEAEIAKLLALESIQKKQKEIKAYQDKIDDAHEQYRRALEMGDEAGVSQWEKTEETLDELLDALYEDSKGALNESLFELIRNQNGEAAGAVEVYSSLLSPVDQGLLASFLNAKDELDEALLGSDDSKLLEAYDALIDASCLVDDSLVSNENKAALLSSYEKKVSDALNRAKNAGNERLVALLSDITKALSEDINRAKAGELLDDSMGNLSDLLLDDNEEANLFSNYDLVCIKKNLSLNGYRKRKDGVEYLPLCELATLFGSQVIRYKNITIIKDEVFLLECEKDNKIVYLDDKKESLALAPIEIDDKLYVTADFFAKCYEMQVIVYHQTLILN